jgi:hypothetical protein
MGWYSKNHLSQDFTQPELARFQDLGLSIKGIDGINSKLLGTMHQIPIECMDCHSVLEWDEPLTLVKIGTNC